MSLFVIFPVAAVGAALAVFLYAVRRRWFSRLESGFALTLMLALGGLGVATAVVLGVLGYHAGREVLFQETVGRLGDMGEIVEGEIHREITEALEDLGNLAGVVAPHLARQASQELRRELETIQRFNPRFLQIDVVDREGRLLLASTLTEAPPEPLSRLAVAFSLEGKPFASDPYLSSAFKKYVLILGVPLQGSQDAPQGTLSARYDLQDRLSKLLDTTRFGESGYVVVANHDGHILGHPDPARVNDDVSTYPAVRRALQGQRGWEIGRNKAGQERLMVYRPVKSVATVNPKPWALVTEVETREALAPLTTFRNHFLLATAGLVVVGLLVARQVSVYIRRPLRDVLDVVRRVRDGDLTVQAPDAGRDEMGRLSEALNGMVRGLQERDRIKEIFGRYVTTQVSEEILKGQINLGGEVRRATILFSDIRNFTTMAETMTPEQVVTFLNDYFSEMVEAVFEQGGVLDKFIGDGMMAVFGSIGDTSDHPRRAVRAALRMKARVAKINGERAVAGKPPIAIGIGIHTDDVIVGNIGSRKRLEYTVIGDGVNTCARVEGLNKEFGTTILITETTYEAVQGEFECRLMPEARLKGKTKAPQVYEVVSARAG